MKVFDALVRAGMTDAAARERSLLFERVAASLYDAEALRWFVPGRIEVLGKHTDYAGGRSLVCAVERGFAVAARPRADALVTIADVVQQASCEMAISPDLEVEGPGWRVCAAAVARRLARDFPGVARGADIAIASDLPAAAGLSSSSALVVAIFAALGAVNDLSSRREYLANIDGVEDLAGYLGCIENGQPYKALAGGSGVGTFGGSEDHAAILASEPRHVKQYSFCPVRWERTIALPAGCAFVVAASGVAADKTGPAKSLYNRASLAAQSVLQIWRTASGSGAPTLAAAATSAPDAPARIRAALRDANADRSLVDRFDQFLRESEEIVPRAADALDRHDFVAFGELVAESQARAETQLGNQVAETTWLAREARALGAFAASAFGAGFGGSVWALVARDDAKAFAVRWRGAYARSGHARARQSEFFVTAAGPPMLRL